MLTIADVATRDGVSKPVVSVRVKRFREQHGLTVELDSQGRVARFNVAEYDTLRGRYDDPSKAQAPRRAEAQNSGGDSSETYDEALRQKTWIETERRRIELDQIKGRLIDTAAVAEGYDRAAAKIQDALDHLDDHADDLAAVVARDGGRGLATALKKLGATVLAEIAAALAGEAEMMRAGLVESAPKTTQ
jgi:hypothetical protein